MKVALVHFTSGKRTSMTLKLRVLNVLSTDLVNVAMMFIEG
jgi:hypothetical protein